MISDYPAPVLGFAAFSGTGKTTLLKRLIPLLRQHGLRIALVKHAHHEFDVDKPGKDSYELRKAGAAQVLVASSRRWALMCDNDIEQEPRLQDMLGRLETTDVDLVLVEGFKRERFPKIELHREGQEHPLLFLSDDSIIALATDAQVPSAATLPVLDINNPEQIAEFIETRILQRTSPGDTQQGTTS